MTKVLSVGHSVLDLIFRVEALPDGDGKSMATGLTSIGGGPAANAAVTIARLGAESHFAGRVGEDHYGKQIVDELKDYGVHCDYVGVIDGATSSLSAVTVDAFGNRQIINYKDARLDESLEQLKSIHWQAFDAVLVDVRWASGAAYALEQAKQHGIPSVLDADINDGDISPLVAMADFIIFSQPGLAQFTQIDDPQQALLAIKPHYSGALSVTLGGDGVLYFDDDGLLKQHVGRPVKVVDTTGAGDVYHGAFAYYLAQYASQQQTQDEAKPRGFDNEAAIHFSTATAALKCTRPGGRQGIPTLAEVEDFL